MTSSASNCKDPVWIDTPFWKTLPDDAKVCCFFDCFLFFFWGGFFFGSRPLVLFCASNKIGLQFCLRCKLVSLCRAFAWYAPSRQLFRRFLELWFCVHWVDYLLTRRTSSSITMTVVQEALNVANSSQLKAFPLDCLAFKSPFAWLAFRWL